MSMAAGALAAMTIGIIGGASLTTWCLWSRHQEIKEGQIGRRHGDDEK